jgi:hypothetical protein
MKFPYDYIALTAVPAFCVGFCAGALITAASATRWLRKHGLGRLVGEEEEEEVCDDD